MASLAPAVTDGRLAPPSSALVHEADAVIAAAGDVPLVYTSLLLAAWRGQEARALALIDASVQDAAVADRDRAIHLAGYARAVLYNGLGRYRAARVAAERTCEHEDGGLLAGSLAELVEAAARSGRPHLAADALTRLEALTREGGTGRHLDLLVQVRAVLAGPDEAECLHREAVLRLAGSPGVLHLARAQLLYGEWLRRQGRRVDARGRLRSAHGWFNRVGADGFAERARRELLATGETVRKRTADTRDDLTAQEAQVARLAGEGYTNPEIGTELFISPRTVEWHLRKVFAKLGIHSRKEL